jgi:hypothetical protein
MWSTSTSEEHICQQGGRPRIHRRDNRKKGVGTEKIVAGSRLHDFTRLENI